MAAAKLLRLCVFLRMLAAAAPGAGASVRVSDLALFPTTVLSGSVKNSPKLNKLLKKGMEFLRENEPSHEKVSNVGGWQSRKVFFEYALPFRQNENLVKVAPAMDRLRDLAVAAALSYLQRTSEHNAGGAEQFEVKLQSSWANVNNKGDLNTPHIHPNCFLSGVYYVDDGGADCGEGTLLVPDYNRGAGCLILHDPRPGATTRPPLFKGFRVSSAVIGTPKSGRMFIFPSYLEHHVEPHPGGRGRYSIAFNFIASKVMPDGTRTPLMPDIPNTNGSTTIPKAGSLLQVEDVPLLWPSTGALSQWMPAREGPLKASLLEVAAQMPTGSDVFAGSSSLAAPLAELLQFIQCSVLVLVCKEFARGAMDETAGQERLFSLARFAPPHEPSLCTKTCSAIEAGLGLDLGAVEVTGTLVHERPDARAAYLFDPTSDFTGMYSLTRGYGQGISTHEPRPASRSMTMHESGSAFLTGNEANEGALLLCPSFLKPSLLYPLQGEARSAIVFNAVVSRRSRSSLDRSEL